MTARLIARLLVLALLAVSSQQSQATTTKKSFWPSPPFVDGCDGMIKKKCTTVKQCGWFEKQIPWCYDKRYIKVLPPPVLRPQADVAKRFFVYSNGVHLSEGTAQKIYYNTNHEECAELCIKSTLEQSNVRCLSFDFYEFPTFDLPAEQVPPNRGVCVLNDNSNENARLRNVDQGYTDEELFAEPVNAGHYRHRLSNFGGHYAVRNPRGGQLAQQLDYPSASSDDIRKIIVWGKSRWGIAHIEPWEKRIISPLRRKSAADGLNCNEPSSWPSQPAPDAQLTYYGGYTPVGEDQKCVGKVTKDEAVQICADSGGMLCPTQKVVKSLESRKIGCSFDKYPTWSAADAAKGKKFVRCCAKYSYPNFCATQYSDESINFCSQFKTFTKCQHGATGYTRQNQWGFGRLLASYRQACTQSGYQEEKCVKALVQDWQPRDRCIWCLEPGTGRGECRAGGDLGVCRSSSVEAQDKFTNVVNTMCGAGTACRLAQKYPDLACSLLGTCNTPGGGGGDSISCATYDSKQSQCEAYAEYCVWMPTTRRCLSRIDDDF